MRYKHQERRYTPITPTPDTDELSDRSARLMLYHTRIGSHTCAPGPSIFWAPKGELHAGWVIGIDAEQSR